MNPNTPKDHDSENCHTPFCRECLDNIKRVANMADKFMDTPKDKADNVELDEILAVFANYDDPYENMEGWEEIQINRIEKAKQSILDWHSKQVAKAELKARLDEIVNVWACQNNFENGVDEYYEKYDKTITKEERIKELESKINE